MSKMTWGAPGTRTYESGVDRGVLFIGDEVAVPWSGLISIDESPSGGSATPYYIDGQKYANRASPEEFEATLTALSSPAEFDKVDGTEDLYVGLYATQQKRRQFSLCYRTRIANDVLGFEYGYKIHFIYNALAAPSGKTYETLSDSSSPTPLAWSIVTVPPNVQYYRPSAHFIIDSTEVGEELLQEIEDALYGSDLEAPRLLWPQDLLDMFADYATFRITLRGVYDYIAEGSLVEEFTPGTFSMENESVIDNGDDTFTIL